MSPKHARTTMNFKVKFMGQETWARFADFDLGLVQIHRSMIFVHRDDPSLDWEGAYFP